MPPVARAGFSNGATATEPSGAAMTVLAPFSTTTVAPRRCGVASGRRARRVVADEIAVIALRAAAPRPEPLELADVRRQHGRPPVAVPPPGHRCERAERLGIEHDRRRLLVVRGREELADELRGGEARSQAGTDDERVVLVVEDPRQSRLRVDLLDVVLGQGHRRGLDDLRGEQRLERLGDGQRDEPRAGPSGRAAASSAAPA